MYAYNAQEHISTHINPFGLCLTKILGFADIVPPILSHKTENGNSLQTMKAPILARINLCRIKATQVSKKEDGVHKANFEKCVHRQPIIEVGYLVYLGKPANNQKKFSDNNLSRKTTA